MYFLLAFMHAHCWLKAPCQSTDHAKRAQHAWVALTTIRMLSCLSIGAALQDYRHMNGSGVHTFTLVNKANQPTLVKFHWLPTAGASVACDPCM